MHTHLFFIISFVAFFAITEAIPWYRSNPFKKNVDVVNGDTSDFGVEEFGAYGGETSKISGGTTSVYPGDQDTNLNQGADEGIGEQGGKEYEGGFGYRNSHEYIGSRRFQDRKYRGYFRTHESLNTGGRNNFGGRYPGSRRNENSGEERYQGDSESGDHSHEYTKKSSRRCVRCRFSNIGSGFNNSNEVFIHEDDN